MKQIEDVLGIQPKEKKVSQIMPEAPSEEVQISQQVDI